MDILPSIVFLVALLTFCFLQAYICKNAKNKKLGLILPIGSFLIATMPIISMAVAFILSILPSTSSRWDFGMTIIGGVTFDFLPGYIIQLFNLIILLIMLYLPTIIFTLIYLHYKKKNKQEGDI